MAAGHVFSMGEPFRDHVGVVQYHAWGTPDSSFGDEGSVLTNASADGFEAARAVLVQPDAKILVAAGGLVGDEASYLSRYVYESARGPFDGVPSVLPGRLEAEDYDLGGNGQGYFDTTAGAEGGFVYRTDDVDLKVSSEGGHAIGWLAAGEWVSYTVDAKTTGNYVLRVHVGSAFAGRTFYVEVDGRDVTGPLVVPQLKEWDQYRTVKVPGVRIDAGERVIRVVMGPEDFMDLQWLDFALEPQLLTRQD